MRHGLASIVILLVLASPTLAVRPDAPAFHVAYFDRQDPVEQQTPGGATQPDRSLWVTNPTQCLWDPDDDISASAYGRFERGASLIFTVCIVGDWAPHLVWIRASNGLATSVAVTDGPVARSCIYGPDYDHDPANPLLSPIAGSNGGVGHVHVVRLTATNTTGHPVKGGVSVGSTLATVQMLDTYCSGRTLLSGEPTWWTDG